MNNDTPLNIGANRQLLLDRKFIAHSRGIRLKMNRPQQEFEPLLVPDQPWERSIGAYNSVVLTDSVYRMWYDVLASQGKGKRHMLAYAESDDGVNWRARPPGMEPDSASARMRSWPPTGTGCG